VSFANAFETCSRFAELRKRLLFTLGLLAVYRIGVSSPPRASPGGDEEGHRSSGGFLNLFICSPGRRSSNCRSSRSAIMPYVSASIIYNCSPSWSRPSKSSRKEGEMGRRKITQWTRYGTIVLSSSRASASPAPRSRQSRQRVGGSDDVKAGLPDAHR